MKKLIIIITLLLITVKVFSQDTCKQYVIRGMDFSKIDTIKVPCDSVNIIQGDLNIPIQWKIIYASSIQDSCKHKHLAEYSVYYESGKRVFYCLDCGKDITKEPKVTLDRVYQGKPADIQDTITIKAQYDTISVAIQKLNTALENSYSQEQKEIVKMITKYIGMQELLLFQYQEERKKK